MTQFRSRSSKRVVGLSPISFTFLKLRVAILVKIIYIYYQLQNRKGCKADPLLKSQGSGYSRILHCPCPLIFISNKKFKTWSNMHFRTHKVILNNTKNFNFFWNFWKKISVPPQLNFFHFFSNFSKTRVRYTFQMILSRFEQKNIFRFFGRNLRLWLNLEATP